MKYITAGWCFGLYYALVVSLYGCLISAYTVTWFLVICAFFIFWIAFAVLSGLTATVAGVRRVPTSTLFAVLALLTATPLLLELFLDKKTLPVSILCLRAVSESLLPSWVFTRMHRRVIPDASV